MDTNGGHAMTATKELTLPTPPQGLTLWYISVRTAAVSRCRPEQLALAVERFRKARCHPANALILVATASDPAVCERYRGTPAYDAGSAFGSGPSVRMICTLDVEKGEWSEWQ